MRAKEFLPEALKPSQYRHLVKNWDKKRYADLFDGKYRIYIPLEAGNANDQPATYNPAVSQEVEKAGYKIDDYVKGIASKIENGRVRQIKIGKLLSPTTAQTFANDPVRQASKSSEKLVAISRHPYDIGGMSTDRGWTSCMNLKTGSNKKYVDMDVKSGTVIAYLIDSNDKNIQNPQARMLIKPFVNIAGTPDIAFGVENKVYGTAPPSFSKTVVAWADKINHSRKLNGIFELDPDLYHDSNPNDHDDQEPERPLIAVDQSGLGQQILQDPIKFVKDHPNASEATLQTLVNYNPRVIQYIKNPSHEIQLIAANQNPYYFKYVKNPSPELQLKMVSRGGDQLEYIRNPSPQIQMAAVTNSGGALKFISNPSRELQLAAVNNNGNAISIINNPSHEVQLAAVRRTPDSIRFIKNPDPEVKALADQLIKNRNYR